MNIIRDQILNSFRNSIQLKTGVKVNSIILSYDDKTEVTNVHVEYLGKTFSDKLEKNHTKILENLLIPKLKKSIQKSYNGDVNFNSFNCLIDFNDNTIIVESVIIEPGETETKQLVTKY